MSLKLAEQLALVQEYLMIDKTDFNRAMADAVGVIDNTKKYLKTLRRIKTLSRQLKCLSEMQDVNRVLQVLNDYPQIKTLREAQILIQVLEGKSNEQIASELNIAIKTVKWHKSNIFRNCGYKNTLAILKDSIAKLNNPLTKGANNG